MRKRHSQAEVVTLLDRAREMTAEGKLQGDIAKALGVSVMTYHRWRKAHANGSTAPVITADRTADAAAHQRGRIGELSVENGRLRRLVTDLLLEKIELEERLRESGGVGRRAGRG